MRCTRLLALASCLALGGAVWLSTAASADLMPAGNYRIASVTADAFMFTSTPPFTEASVFVQDTTTQSDPLVGPSGTTRVVQLSVFWSSPTSAGSGCSVLANPGDFTSSATAASLQTTLTGSEQPCDQFEQVLPLVSVTAAWTTSASRGSGRTSSQYACGAYTSETRSSNAFFGANASFSISALAGSFTDNEASLGSNEQNIHAQGTLASTCFQPGSKGAGPGPQAPGRATFISSLASFSQSPSDTSDPHVNVFVNRFTNTTNPLGGPPSTTSETDVSLFVSGSAGFAIGCFVLKPPAAFTFGLTSATLHISLDSNTPVCQPAPPFGFPFLPTEVDVTWTGVGPVATLHSTSQGACANFSEETFFDDQDNNATATATLSFFQGTTFNGGQSFLGTSNHSFQVQGVTRCPGGK